MARDPRCPCRSGRKYRRCCLPLHQGRAAPSPEALMRSRFAAYALGDVDYVVATTDPAGPMWEQDEARWRASIARFCEATRFAGLQILWARDDEVAFEATLVQQGEEAPMRERSRFRQVEGRWRYWGGERI